MSKKPLIERLPPSMKTPLAKFVGGSILVTGIVSAAFWVYSQNDPPKAQEVSYTKFKQLVDEKKFAAVNATKDPVSGQITYKGHSFKDGKSFIAYDFPDKEMASAIEKTGGFAEAKKIEPTPWWQSALIFLIPTALLIGFFIWQGNRQNKNQSQLMGGAQGGAMAFGKSRAKLMDQSKSTTTFKDVAGVNEAKEDVKELVDFLKDPEKFQKLGGHIPRGVLLVGPPGTGKTLLGKAVAGEAKVPFFYVSGADFVQMFVGVGAARVNDMFEQAKKCSPCIIFVDEIDAIGGKRDDGGSNDERRQTLNAMLVNMDGFDTDAKVIVMAATNTPDSLDPALKRPGRFDREVNVGLPDLKGRYEILNVHKKGKPMGSTVSMMDIARATNGFSGASLANLLNEGALFAARRDAKAIHMIDIMRARDKITMGAERKNASAEPDDIRETAEHEAGHGLVAYYLKEVLKFKVNKITVIPRGRALGVTQTLFDKDMMSYNREQMRGLIAYMYGGRAAEIICRGQMTTGAANDIERATQYARDMVTKFGMSKDLVARNYEPDRGRFGYNPTISENLMREVDDEIRGILEAAEARAFHLINDHKDQFNTLVEGAMEFGTLEEEDIRLIMEGGDMERLRKMVEAREEAIKQAVDKETAEEPLTAEVDDAPKGVAKGDLWNHIPR